MYQFDHFELDPRLRELRRGTAVLDIEPQVFDLLHYLVENADRVVSKDEVIEAVWQGRVVSESTLSSRISMARRVLGDSGEAQRLIRTVPRRGFRFVGAVAGAGDTTARVDETSVQDPVARQTDGSDVQAVRFCRSGDGTQIAYATSGAGYPLVRAGHWLTHLEHDWNSPIWRPFLDRLGQNFAVTRYDQRGCGLSDWELGATALDDFVADLDAVVDAAGLERFALFGTSQGAPQAIRYAVRHPERVSHLILHGGYAQGRLVRDDEAAREEGEALITLMRHGWGKAGSQFLKAFTAIYIPNGNAEQTASLVDLQRLTTTGENAVRLRTAVDRFDVADEMSEVAVPTLVSHARHDGVHPLSESRKLAGRIAGAQFVEYDSANHMILPQEPEWERFNETLRRFVLG